MVVGWVERGLLGVQEGGHRLPLGDVYAKVLSKLDQVFSGEDMVREDLIYGHVVRDVFCYVAGRTF